MPASEARRAPSSSAARMRAGLGPAQAVSPAARETSAPASSAQRRRRAAPRPGRRPRPAPNPCRAEGPAAPGWTGRRRPGGRAARAAAPRPERRACGGRARVPSRGRRRPRPCCPWRSSKPLPSFPRILQARRPSGIMPAPWSRPGPEPQSTLPVVLAIVVTLAGIAAMLSSMALTAPHIGSIGIRGLLVISEAALVLPALLVVALRRMPPSQASGFGPSRGAPSCSRWPVGAALWLASLGLLGAAVRRLGPARGLPGRLPSPPRDARPRGPLDALSSLLAIAIVPALCEEALLRGILLPSLRPAASRAAPDRRSHRARLRAHRTTLYRVPFTFVGRPRPSAPCACALAPCSPA